MAATVPEFRPTDLVESAVQITRGVRAVSWVEAAWLQCWLAGRGSMDVPAHAPNVSITTSTTSAFRYWTKPRFQTCRYALGLVLVGESGGECTVRVPSGSSGGTSIQLTPHQEPSPATILFDRSAQSAAEAELSFDIVTTSTAVKVESISIEAVPRTTLATESAEHFRYTHAGDRRVTHAGDRRVTHASGLGSDLGVDRLKFWPRQPIFETTFAQHLLQRQNDLRDACRRVGMFQFSRGTANPWLITTASPSWSSLFVDGIAMLGRFLYSTDTVRTMSWRVLAKCSDGSTAGAIRVNNTSGGTAVSTITIPAGTTDWTWLPSTAGAAATFTCDAENNTISDGRRSSRDDEHTFEANRTAGTGSVQIATISVFEA